MNNRLIIQDIAGLLSEKTGKSKSECERFLRTFIAVVSEGLTTDKLVKVKGIGSFKLALMEERESVNVNTGERFTIPAYCKCTFLPDSELKELVNEPFSFFETVELGEEVDAQQMDMAPDTPEEETEQPEEIVVTPPQPAPAASDKPVLPVVPVTPATPIVSEPSKGSHRWGWISSVIVFLLILGGTFLYLYTGSHFMVDDKAAPPSVVLSDPIVQDETALQPLLEDSGLLSEEVDNIEDLAAMQQEKVTPFKETDTSFKEVKIIKIKENDRLTYLAEEYYGNRVFWVYIYQFNRTVIRNPDVITLGMELILPDPAVYGINANDSASIRRAIQLEKEIKEAKK